MAASVGNNAQAGTLTEALGRLDVVETRLSRLEQSVNRAVGTLMPKVEALLSERSEGEGSTSSPPAPSSPAPPSSPLGFVARGDGETPPRVLTGGQVDIGNDPPCNECGDTPLYEAADGGHLKAVMALLEAGAAVDVSGHRLRTPLHCAAAHGHLQIARRLLLAGVKVDVKDVDGATPLLMATESRHREIVHLLLEKGANGTSSLELATRKGYTEIVEILLESGVQGNEKLASMAISQGSKCLVELFVQKGMSPDVCNENGEPLLVQSAKANRWDLVELLLRRGASSTKCKANEECALVYASKGGQADAVGQLLRGGAASNAEQVRWALLEAPSAAVVWAFVNVVPAQVLTAAGSEALTSAGGSGRLEPLKALLEAGVNINSKDKFNVTALHWASLSGHIECVRVLLQSGANPNARSFCASTPLHFASANNHVDCVRALFGAGANVAERDSDGRTPLDLAKTEEVRRALNGQ